VNDGFVILVVDDDPNARDVVARLLQREGYKTHTAGSGPECLQVVQTHRVDLVLLDVVMPGMDGFAVCDALHAIEAGKKLPVILLTGQDDVDTRLEGIYHGVSEFLGKPINPRELYARVRSQLHIVELTQQLESVERNLKAWRPGPVSH